MAVLRLGCALLLWLAGAAFAAPFAYIPHDGGTAVIDIATHRVVQQVPVTGRDIALQPEGTRAYVVDNPIHVIDIHSQQVTLQLDGGDAYYMALSPREPKAVLLTTGGGVRVIDVNSRGTLATLNLGGALRRVAFDPSGQRAFISDAAAGRVYVLSMATYQVVSTISLGATPTDLLVHPAHPNQLYVALTSSNAVRLINVEDGSTLATINVNVAPSDLVADVAGARLYVSNTGSNTVSVIDTASNTVVATIPVGAAPQGIDMTPDGGFVYVVNTGAGSVSVIATQTLALLDGIGVGTNLRAQGSFIGGPVGPAPSPVGPYSGLWWNPAESGWGVHLTQRRNIVFAAWFTYGSGGNAHWYVADNCPLGPDPRCPTCPQQAYCEGTLIETRGPDIQQEPFRPADVTRGGVGTFKLRFDSFDRGTLSFTLYGEAEKSVAIQRQMFGSGPIQGTNFTDLWWNPDESGWGLGITHQGNLMFLTWFAYDSNRLPGWYVASRCEVTASGDGCRGRLYRTSGPRSPRTPANTFETERLFVDDVGSVELRFIDENSAVMSYILRGATQTKTIRRQFF